MAEEERKREKEAAAARGRTDDDGRPVGCDDSDGENRVMRDRERIAVNGGSCGNVVS